MSPGLSDAAAWLISVKNSAGGLSCRELVVALVGALDCLWGREASAEGSGAAETVKLPRTAGVPVGALDGQDAVDGVHAAFESAPIAVSPFVSIHKIPVLCTFPVD